MTVAADYDVIIIGAGLAGLSAAVELNKKGKKILILESEKWSGGKVRTCSFDGALYETGALFAFDTEWVGCEVDTGRRFSSDQRIGLFHDGRLISGESVAECLAAVSNDPRQFLCVRSLIESPSPEKEMIGETLFEAANAFFRVIHPGDMVDYVPARRFDCLVKHDASSFENGNSSLVRALIKESGAEIKTGSRVLSVTEEGGMIHVCFLDVSGSEKNAVAENVIVAAPAPEALEILKDACDNLSTEFLKRVSYGSGLVVSLLLENTILKDLSYIVATSGKVNTFVFQRYPDSNGKILVTAYIVGENAESLRDLEKERLVEKVLDELIATGAGEVSDGNLMCSDVFFWPGVGPLITDTAYSGFSTACLLPLKGVFLAGDYTWWDQQEMPYGMYAAIESGKRAAKMVSYSFKAESVSFRPAPLADTCLTRISDKGPEFIENLEDGNIAYYGWLLKAKPDAEIEAYLAAVSEDGLWAYHHGYNPTSLDSAIVIEGLLGSEKHHELLKYSAKRLVEEFFDQDEGAFRTISRNSDGRAPYWKGADCPATAACAWLLQIINPHKYSAIIDRCVRYIHKKQLIPGYWPGKWFPSRTIPVFYSMRLLRTVNEADSAPLRRAVLWLKSQQKKDGSWSGSVIETSAAVLALSLSGGNKDEIASGQNWIRTRADRGRWSGEPILEYFFDDNGIRTFFYSRDKGAVTSAWAELALKSSGLQG